MPTIRVHYQPLWAGSPSTRFYHRALVSKVTQGNPLAAHYRLLLEQAPDPDAEAARQQAEVQQQLDQLRWAGRILADAIAKDPGYGHGQLYR